jgi:catechol 2,3-dioxygenase-like lactoylglutathione lyase family enzyme
MNLNQVTVPSRNLEVSIAFYQGLGLELIVDSRPRYARFVLPEGQATLSLHLSEELEAGSGGIQLYFECEDLDAKVRQLQSNGIAFESLPEDKSWLWREAWLYDPDGHHLCLFYGGNNRVNPPWRIDYSSSESESESE